MRNPIEEVIEILGSQTALAKIIGIKQPNISKWLKNGVIPPRKVLLVESLTGISRHRLNPEIYPKDNR